MSPLPAPALRRTLGVAAAMALAAVAAWALTPVTRSAEPVAQLAQVLPTQFAQWRMLPDTGLMAPVSDGTDTSIDQPYDQTVMRRYVDPAGRTVMLAVAWSRYQRQDVKVHRPEVCYPAQGFSIREPGVDERLALPDRAEPITVRRLLAQHGNELEAVRYWIRIGTRYGGDGLSTRLYLLREGFQGRVPDGILVRASLRLPANPTATPDYPLLDQFLRDLVAAAPAPARALLVQ